MTEPHLDDESLSAAIDGQDAQAGAHLAACAACRTRGDALDAARRAVAAPPASAPAGLADRAVAAALAAYAGERAHRDAGDATAGGGAPVVPLGQPLSRPPGSFASAGPAAHRRRVRSWVLGAAAALAAVLVAVPLLDRSSDHGAGTLATGAGTDRTTEPAALPPVDGGDLGDQSDQLALGSVLTAAVTNRNPSANVPAVPTATADQSTAALGGGARSTDLRATTSPSAPVGAEASPAPQPVTPAPSPAGTTDPAAIAACEAAAAKDFGNRVGPLLYRATLRWQGTPAVLLAYRLADTSSKGPDHQAFVMALDDCRVLVAQGF